jgi:hypothetical protein
VDVGCEQGLNATLLNTGEHADTMLC